ncbi:right-handed parallel beta-helix repeat-containing protein, partial [bacterium]|nr:right-handed parallel beta-helix repeat-containing protein [bacterium]
TITGLTNGEGWSGAAATGNGSGGWLAAKHAVPQLANQANARLRVVFGSDGSVQNGDGFAFDDFQIYDTPGFDIGVTAIDAPITPVAPGLAAVDVTISNFGLNTITAASIGWSVDGVVQTPFGWTGSIAQGVSIAAPQSIGSFNFTTGFHTIKAWTSMPNMTPDQINPNDTLSVQVLSCTSLSGAYTLGGVGADFATFADAAFALGSCGVSGAVSITVNPGSYTDAVSLGPISGSSAANTILFDGMDSAMVSLSWNSGPTVNLAGTEYITFRNMTVVSTGITDAFGFHLSDTASWVTIDACHIIMDPSAGIVDVIGVSASNSLTSSFTEGQNASWTTVSNCRIDGGEKGIHFEGQFNQRNVGNRFMNNHMVGQDDYGIYVDDQDSIMIMNNVIEGLKNTNADGIYCFDIQMFTISGNQAFDVPDWGLRVDDGNFASDGTPTSRGLISNNMVSSNSDYGLYLDDVEQTDVWHNSFATSSTASGAMRVNDIDSVDIRNNIFVQFGTDFAFESLDVLEGSNNVLNYNLYWTPVGNARFVDEGPLYADLAAWQLASPSLNVNSVEGDPGFIGGTSDLHLIGIAANDVGDNSVGIAVDIDGDVRPAAPSTTVDMGADEYSPRQNDAVLVEFLAPGSLACGDSTTVVMVAIANQGQVIITSLPVTVNVTGDITQTLNATYTGPLAFGETDTFMVGTLNTYGGGRVMIDGSVVLPMDEDTTNDALTPYAAEFIPAVPQVNGAYACGDDSALVSVNPWTGTTYGFYATPTDTVPVAVGNSFMVPSIATQGTYYVEALNNSDSLSTPFNFNNGAGGNMWDVVALNTVSVTSLAIDLDAGTVPTTDIWYRPGTFVGNETNPNGDWVLLGTAANVLSAGPGVPTFIPVTFSVTIPAGQTYAFYIQTSTNLVNYTNGTTVGNVLVQNADVQILEGVGKSAGAAFATSTFSPRVWNGILTYGSTSCSNIRVPVSAVAGVPAAVDLGADVATCDTSATLDAGNPMGTYLWSTGDISNMISVNTGGMYSVAVTDSNGCAGVDTAMVTFNITPTVDLGMAPEFCDGDNATLDAGNAGATYLWSNGATTQTTTVSTAGNTSVDVIAANGCSASDTVNVTVNALPVVDLGPDTLLCDGDFITLDAGNAGAAYTWASGATTQTDDISTAGTAYVDVIDTNGCTASDSVNVSTAVTPTAGYTFAAVADTVDFTDASTGTPAIAWAWDFGDGNTSALQNPQHTYLASGTFVACLVVSEVCGNDTLCQDVVVIATGLNELLNIDQIKFFPNPTRGVFFLTANVSQPAEMNIEITDAIGKTVLKRNEGTVSGNYRGQFDISEVPSGVYLLRIESNGRVATYRIIRN